MKAIQIHLIQPVLKTDGILDLAYQEQQIESFLVNKGLLLLAICSLYYDHVKMAVKSRLHLLLMQVQNTAKVTETEESLCILHVGYYS